MQLPLAQDLAKTELFWVVLHALTTADAQMAVRISFESEQVHTANETHSLKCCIVYRECSACECASNSLKAACCCQRVVLLLLVVLSEC